MRWIVPDSLCPVHVGLPEVCEFSDLFRAGYFPPWQARESGGCPRLTAGGGQPEQPVSRCGRGIISRGQDSRILDMDLVVAVGWIRADKHDHDRQLSHVVNFLRTKAAPATNEIPLVTFLVTVSQ